MEKEIVCKGVMKMSGEKKYRVELEGKEDFLWITDNREQAEEWKAQGRAVLIYLHEGNRGQDFSGFRYAVEEPEDLDEVYVERIYRRLKGLPWKILETERCIVRETTEDDVEDFYNIYQEPAITKYMEGLFPEKSAERQYIREYIEKVYGYYEFGVWTVLEKESGAVIGRAGFSYREGYRSRSLVTLSVFHGSERGMRRRYAGAFWILAGRNWALGRYRCWWKQRTSRPCICAGSWDLPGRKLFR